MGKPNNTRAKRTGIAAVIGASLMWAIEPSLIKLAFDGSSVVQTAAVRATVVAMVALLYVVITGSSLKISRRHLSKIAFIALAGTVIADLLYIWALSMVPVINAVLIGHMQPVFIVLAGFLVLKEDRLVRSDLVGIPILIIAGLLVSTRTPGNLVALKLGAFGDLIVLGATFAWAVTGIVARKYLREVNTGVLTFYRFAFASVALVSVNFTVSPGFSFNIYHVFVGIVVGAGYILYYEGLKRAKAAQVAATELSTPFFAALLGFLILGEIVTIMQGFGIAALFAGVYFLSRKEEVPF